MTTPHPELTIAGSASKPHDSRFFLSLFLWLVAATILAIPTVVFFVSHQARGLGQAQTLMDFSQRIFPLIGLYAFTLVWVQIMIGSFAPFWRKFFPRVMKYHRWVGIFTLVFACLHPLLLLIGVGPTVYFARTYVAPNLVPFIWVGYVQLLLLITTASTALLMKVPWLRRKWRVIHLLNYVVFYLVLIHSWALGYDVRSSAVLQGLWIVYGLSVSVALVMRVIRARRRQPVVQANLNTVVDLGPLEGFPNHQGKPVQVGPTTVAIFRNDDKIWAIANTCSHADGPLCEGVFDGATVVCPWHGSRFDLATGAVLKGPATQPRAIWSVTVRNGTVLLNR